MPTSWDRAGAQVFSGPGRPPIEMRKDIMKQSIKLGSSPAPTQNDHSGSLTTQEVRVGLAMKF